MLFITKLKLSIVCFMIFLISMSTLILANPQGPSSINISNSGRNAANSNPVVIEAKAGNVTALVIDSTRVTQAWQGYYGNITGTITLDDSYNYTIFDWYLPDPEGEVYASNGSSVTWADIYCLNLSANGVQPGSGIVQAINGSQLELNFGINATDTDGVNETFNDTFTGSFYIGSNVIDSSDGCAMTHPYTNEAYNDDWDEILLSDNESIIFTSIIRKNGDGYQPLSQDTFDFQMIVLENGHSGSESTNTNYYFYVEIS